MIKRHTKPTKENKGGIISRESFIHQSNVKNIDTIGKTKTYNIGRKYQLLDKIFLKVLENHPEKMPNIFFNMFKTSSNTAIKYF